VAFPVRQSLQKSRIRQHSTNNLPTPIPTPASRNASASLAALRPQACQRQEHPRGARIWKVLNQQFTDTDLHV